MQVLSLFPLLAALAWCPLVVAHKYGIVVDAGSSASRARIYYWHDRIAPNTLPEFVEVDNKKVKPGLADVASKSDQLRELISFSKEQIPEENWKYSPIFVLATAGMRLLLEQKADAIMDEVRAILSDTRISPFFFRENQARILAGEEEGVYAWVSANYLDGFFSQGSNDDSQSTGILEMGGASTQIAFIPDKPILENKYPVLLGGRTYALYVHSYLSYGQELTKTWIDTYIYNNRANNETDLANPCMLTGDTSQRTFDGNAVMFRGSSNPPDCEAMLDVFIQKAPPAQCSPKPCAIGSVYQPTLPTDKPFFALVAYVYALKFLNVTGVDGTFTPNAVYQAAVTYCRKSLEEVVLTTDEDPFYLSTYCHMGLYIPLLLVEAYGFDFNTQNIKVKDIINGQSPEWTLGAIILETENLNLPVKPPNKPKGSGAQRRTLCLELIVVLVILILI